MSTEPLDLQTLDAVLAVMRRRHYPKPWTFRTNDCYDNHWEWDAEDERHTESCYRDGTICSGCGSETCSELPDIEALRLRKVDANNAWSDRDDALEDLSRQCEEGPN